MHRRTGLRRSALVAALAGSLTSAGHAETQVSGPIDEDTTWAAADGPFIVTGDVVVRNDATLVIEAGTDVRFQPLRRIRVGLTPAAGTGTLIARGTAEAPIRFSSNNKQPTAGNYVGIWFSDFTVDAAFDESGQWIGGSVIEHATIDHAGLIPNVGAITIADASPLLRDVTVSDSGTRGVFATLGSSDPTLQIVRCTFRNCGAPAQDGGGAFIDGLFSSATLIDCRFENNRARSGGGAYIRTELTMLGCTFTGNGADVDGGGLFVDAQFEATDDNLIEGNSAERHGGGVVLSGSNYVFAGATIRGNTAGTSGGGIYTSGTSTSLVVRDSTIEFNTTNGDGGGAWSDAGTPLFENSSVSNNSAAGRGGGLAHASGVNFSGGEIRNNVASTDGGGISCIGYNLVLEDVVIEDNEAGLNGGGIDAETQFATLTDVTIRSNDALTGSGGGIRATGRQSTWTRVDVDSNTSGERGGGVFLDRAAELTRFVDCSITGNDAAVDGGGIVWAATGGRMDSEPGAPATIVAENTAPVGAAIVIEAALDPYGSADLDARGVDWGTTDPAVIVQDIIDFRDDANLAVVRLDAVIGTPVIEDTTWTVAGGPYVMTETVVVGEDATLTIEPGTEVRFMPGTALVVGIDAFGDGRIDAAGTADAPIVLTSAMPAGERSPGDWSGVVLGPGATGDARLEHAIIEWAGGGPATDLGALALHDPAASVADVLVRDAARTGVTLDSVVTGDWSIERISVRRSGDPEVDGGGLRVRGTAQYQLIDWELTANRGRDGGGAFVDPDDATFTGGVIADNIAEGDGGGVHVLGERFTSTGTAYIDNRAGGSGGGLQLAADDPILAMIEVRGNEAMSGDGGGLSAIRWDGRIDDSTFAANAAGGNGGGIRIDRPGWDLAGLVVEDNSAIGNGGGIEIGFGASNVRIESSRITANTAGAFGGGVRLQSGSTNLSGDPVRFNVIAGNTAPMGPALALTISSFPAIPAEWVCWGVDADDVGLVIHDGADDSALGLIDASPPLPFGDCADPPIPCPADLDGTGAVGFGDLLMVLDAWGTCDAPPAECPGDVDEDLDVDMADLLTVLGSWGLCP